MGGKIYEANIYEPISKKKPMCVCALKFKAYCINYRWGARAVVFYIYIFFLMHGL